MIRAWSAGLVVLGAIACGEGGAGPGPLCPNPPDPGPMSAARAATIAPEVRTGLALSTTHVQGDCRPRPAPAEGGFVDPCGDGLCERGRAPLRVRIVPANVSVPLSDRCGDAPEAVDLDPLAVADAIASEAGEVVFALPAGSYRPYLEARDGCAPCGDPGAGICAVEVEAGRVASRDLVLDEAAR